MTQSKSTRLLAIAIDAAEPTLVRRLIDEGQMPALGSLLRDGTWLRVKSPACVGSGSVWPTFMSAQGPEVHGIYGEWLWDPGTMSLSRYHGNDIAPFWKVFSDENISLGILDVPFMPMIGLTKGFEISEWGPHDILEGRMQLAPESVATTVAKYSPHPLRNPLQLSGPDDYRNLESLGNVCLQGIQKRGNLARDLLTRTEPQFAIITFTEIHRSAHYLWHKVEPEHPLYLEKRFDQLSATHPSVIEIFRELDRQIEAVITAVGENVSVVVFSLHGMKPAHGTPAFLPRLLCDKRFARMPGWRDQKWKERATTAFAAVKQSLPLGLKKLYYKVVPPTVTHQLARPTMLPLYDWSRTRAFALPTDQHGWIRINLSGRELRGIVPAEKYQETCDQLEDLLRNLRSNNGELLVSDVIRTSNDVTCAMHQRLPDLIVHWSDSVFASQLRLAESKTQPEFSGRKYVGQHALEGFCIAPAFDSSAEPEIRVEEMHVLFSRLLHRKPLSQS
jgi:predicted AlkP superfamily phosphohydrolase/phosphomutase